MPVLCYLFLRRAFWIHHSTMDKAHLLLFCWVIISHSVMLYSNKNLNTFTILIPGQISFIRCHMTLFRTSLTTAADSSCLYAHSSPPLFTLPLSCLIDFMPVHEKDPAFHLLCLYSQCNTKFSCALTLLTEIIPKFSSLLLLQEMLKSHFQLNLTWSTTGGMEKSSL